MKYSLIPLIESIFYDNHYATYISILMIIQDLYLVLNQKNEDIRMFKLFFFLFTYKEYIYIYIYIILHT